MAIYAGSEAARGVESMGMKRPDLKDSSIAEFEAIMDGSFFEKTNDATVHYGSIKYIGSLWMSAMARRFPDIRFVTMSPGATVGTEGFNSLSLIRRVMMKSAMQVMLLLGKVHKVETGAKRYIDGLMNAEYQSGVFYGSEVGLTGPVSDQSLHFADIANVDIQERAFFAIERKLIS